MSRSSTFFASLLRKLGRNGVVDPIIGLLADEDEDEELGLMRRNKSSKDFWMRDEKVALMLI